MVKTYLAQTKISTLFILLDSRHPLQAIDLTFLAWVVQAKIPYALVLTKADKCKRREINEHIRLLEEELNTRRWQLPPLFVTAAKRKNAFEGHKEVLMYIKALFEKK